MPYHPMLPKLKEGTGREIKNFDDKGKWQPRNPEEIMSIVNSLDAEKFELDVNSVPDIWARAILFEIALFDKSHSLHERILGEWRGLLALLALKEVKNFDINIEKLENRTNSSFYNVIHNLAPRKSLFTDISWKKDIFLIRFGKEKKPIGITSPTTLICTATDCYGRVPDVRWVDGRFLQDPIKAKEPLNDQERPMMLKWLLNLESKLKDHSNINKEEYENEWNELLDNIGSFIEDLGGRHFTIPEDISLSENSLGMKTSIFQYMDFPVKKIKKGESDVFLEASEKRKLNIKKSEKDILVVDEAIANQWKKDKKDIRVWGTYSLADAIPYGGLKTPTNMIKGESLGDRIEVWGKKEFFTDKLYVILKENALPGALDVTAKTGLPLKYKDIIVTPLLPLKPGIMEYIDSFELSQKVSFSKKGDVITAKLEIPLSGSKIPFVIQKDFDYKNGEVIEIPDVPILEIWPNFSFPQWKAYFFYFSTDDQPKRFYAKPFVPAVTRDNHNQSMKIEEDADIKKKSGVSTKETKVTIKKARGAVVSEITRMERFPEGLLCYWDTAEYAGLILFDPPPSPLIGHRETWKIGIDFGTTNTTAFVSAGDAIPKALNLNPRLFSISHYEKRVRRLWEEFLPSGKPIETPFQSIFHQFSPGEEKNDLCPLIDGHIYFFQNYRDFRALALGIMCDLKWGKPEERKRAEALIEQLCLQSAAEAITGGAKEISWRFSFPTAFTSDERENFRKMWINICNRVKDISGIAITVDSPAHKTESVSSAHYFANIKQDIRELNTQKGAVCIDIGGGTSDISIWQNIKDEDYDLRLQTSLRLAGRELFLSLLYQNPEFIKKFLPDQDTYETLKKTREKPSAFFAQIDSVIGNEGGKWLQDLPKLLGDQKVKDFTQLISIGLGGLLYYIGLLLHILKDQKKFNPVDMPDVYIGGNGAHLFDWIASGSFDQKSQINHVLKYLVLEASDFKKSKTNFEIYKSPNLKAEVAYGLVVDEKKLREESEKFSQEQVTAGENFEEKNGTIHDWKTQLTPEILKTGIRIQNISNFLKFILTFNTFSQQITKPPIPYDDKLIKDIINKVNDNFLDIELADIKQIRVEPVFISVLKVFLEEKAREWGGKR